MEATTTVRIGLPGRRPFAGIAAALLMLSAGLATAMPGLAQDESGPDLVTQDLQVDAHEIVGGETLEVHVRVENAGDEVSQAGTVAFELDDGRSFEVDLPKLEPGWRDVVAANWSAEAGNRTLEATADAEDNVTETNEANNALATTYHVDPRPRPNLEARAHVGPYDHPVDGEQLEVEIEVQNTADPEHDEELAEADTFQVEILRDGELVTRTRTDWPLRPGGEVEMEIGPWTATTGNHTITVVVDVADEIHESNETDNRLVHDFHVSDTYPAPNLRAAGVDVFPLEDVEDRPVIEGDRVHLRALVDHAGAAVDEFQMRVGLDGVTVEDDPGGPLSPRTGFFRPVAWTAEAGNHTATLDLDTTDVVDETHEADNRVRTTFRVLEKANPAVTGLEVEEPLVPWAGHEVRLELSNAADDPMVEDANLTVDVCPAGQARIGAQCRPLDAPGSIELGPGETRTVETSWDATGQLGSFEVCAELEYGVIQSTFADDEACEEFVAVASAGSTASVSGKR